MAGIIPNATDGGLQYRTQAGTCSTPANVQDIYCPPATFVMNCDLYGLPSDCTARITPRQINAIMSELLCFAHALNPNGPWNCNSTCNLATLWTASQGSSGLADQVTIGGTGTAADPYRVIYGGLISTQAGNLLETGSDGKLFINATDIAAGLCADPNGDSLAACLLSTDAGNSAGVGTDGRIFVAAGTQGAPIVPPAGTVTCSAATVGTLQLSACGTLQMCDGTSFVDVVDDTGEVQFNLFSATATLPAGSTGTVLGTASVTTITNPSPCRTATMTLSLLGGDVSTGTQGVNPTQTQSLQTISFDGGATFSNVGFGAGGSSSTAGPRNGVISYNAGGGAPTVTIPPGGSVNVHLRTNITDTQTRATQSSATVYGAVNVRW